MLKVPRFCFTIFPNINCNIKVMLKNWIQQIQPERNDNFQIFRFTYQGFPQKTPNHDYVINGWSPAHMFTRTFKISHHLLWCGAICCRSFFPRSIRSRLWVKQDGCFTHNFIHFVETLYLLKGQPPSLLLPAWPACLLARLACVM